MIICVLSFNSTIQELTQPIQIQDIGSEFMSTAIDINEDDAICRDDKIFPCMEFISGIGNQALRVKPRLTFCIFG